MRTRGGGWPRGLLAQEQAGLLSVEHYCMHVPMKAVSASTGHLILLGPLPVSETLSTNTREWARTHIAEVAYHCGSILNKFLVDEVEHVLVQESGCGGHVQA